MVLLQLSLDWTFVTSFHSKSLQNMKVKIFILLLGGLGLLAFEAKTQSLGRVTFSSGGGSVNQMPCSFGEVFSGGNGRFTMGSQQGQDSITIAVNTLSSSLIEVKIAPNPVKEILSVELPDFADITGWAIVFSVSGTMLSRQQFVTEQFEIVTRTLPKGSYLLTLINDSGTAFKSLPFIKL